jgi:hypothetical protein
LWVPGRCRAGDDPFAAQAQLSGEEHCDFGALGARRDNRRHQLSGKENPRRGVREAGDSPEAAREVLAQADGVELADDIDHAVYPMPMNATGRENVLVGRICKDLGFENGLALFVSGDNLWKRAEATVIQIAEKLIEMSA